MGACASLHKNSSPSPPPLKLSFSFRPKTHDDNKFMIPSPVVKDADGKDKLPSNNLKTDHLTFNSFQPPTTLVRDFASKEETFFDTQPWLESDCDDDFYSVNGSEFTPSRGSTPVHHSFSVGTRPTIHLNRADFEEKMPLSIPTPSPTKSLSELFQESSDDEQEERKAEPNSTTDVKPTIDDLNTPKSPQLSPCLSGATSVRSRERTPNGNIKKGKERSLKTVHCCIPRLLPTSLSFTEGKKSMTPA